MTRIPYVMIASIAVLAATPGSAHDQASEKLSASVRREMAAQGPIVTEADHALIARKCGDRPGTRNADVHIGGDTLRCANGRRVALDDELRAMTKRITARAQRHADVAMKSAAVARAQAEVAQAAAARAMEKVRPLLERLER